MKWISVMLALLILCAGVACGKTAAGNAPGNVGGDELGAVERANHPQVKIGANFYLNLKDKLGLTEEQMKRLTEIRDNFKNEADRIKKEAVGAREELNALMKQEQPDLNAVEGKLKQISSLRIDFVMKNLRAHEDARNVLTDEQKAKLKELVKQVNEKKMEKKSKNK